MVRNCPRKVNTQKALPTVPPVKYISLKEECDPDAYIEDDDDGEYIASGSDDGCDPSPDQTDQDYYTDQADDDRPIEIDYISIKNIVALLVDMIGPVMRMPLKIEGVPFNGLVQGGPKNLGPLTSAPPFFC